MPPKSAPVCILVVVVDFLLCTLPITLLYNIEAIAEKHLARAKHIWTTINKDGNSR